MDDEYKYVCGYKSQLVINTKNECNTRHDRLNTVE